MNEIKITERGWAGHFICANECRFRRNTLIESGDIQIVVSTVGQYVNPSNGKIDEIGCNRWYETMAFKARKDNGYTEADVTEELCFDSEAGIYGETWDDVRVKYPLVDNYANDMHDKVVAEFIDRIKRGDLYERYPQEES